MDDIDLRAWLDKFGRDWKLRAQQTKPRLLSLCESQPDEIDGRYFYFDVMGNTDPVLKQSFAEDTPDISVGNERRQSSWAAYHWGKKYDEDQLKRLIGDPKPKHQQLAVAGFNRLWDRQIIAAATGNVNVVATDGTSSVTPTALPSAQVLTEAGTNGLTIAKLNAIRELFDNAEVDESVMGDNGQVLPGMENRAIICNSRQISNLLSDDKIGSSLYNQAKALFEGRVSVFMGFSFIRTTQLSIASQKRKVIALAKGAIGVPPIQEPTVKGQELGTKSFAFQLYLKNRLGAVRIEDVRVVTQECYEA